MKQFKIYLNNDVQCHAKTLIIGKDNYYLRIPVLTYAICCFALDILSKCHRKRIRD